MTAKTITGALVLLVYAVVEAPENGWGDPQTTLLFAASAALLAAFILIESRHRAPLVPLRILRSRTRVGANAVILIFSTAAFGMPFILTLYAQVLDYSAVRFGLSSPPLPLGAVVGSLVGQAIVLRVGFRISTVAVCRTDDFVAENGAGNLPLALTEGFQSAFVACAELATIGVVLSLLLLGRPRVATQEELPPVPVPTGD